MNSSPDCSANITQNIISRQGKKNSDSGGTPFPDTICYKQLHLGKALLRRFLYIRGKIIFHRPMKKVLDIETIV